ncbi:hypothetical protein KY340_00665 [Candidatus Woesearchaeota archaeon]|nr:hypothetical protein [Candidatus Woesearchaeota archaeon]
MKTDPFEQALRLRETLLKDNKILVVDFSDTLQGKDTSRVVELMPNIHSGKYLFRTKVNVKEIDPVASAEYGTDFFDISTMSDKEIEDFIKMQEFDFPLWFKHINGFHIRNIMDYNPPFILQVAGCNFHDSQGIGGCTYCFVDDESNDGKPSRKKEYLSVNDTVDSFVIARSRIRKFYKEYGLSLMPSVLRMSGGEPTLALDWALNLWRIISKMDFNVVGQIDSNLSTGHLIERFEETGTYEKNILEKLAEHPIKMLAALKGTDELNLQENAQSKTTLEEQLYSLKKLILAGFDVFIQLYNPNPDSLESFLTRMDKEIEDFSLKVHIGPLKMYGPNRARLQKIAIGKGLNPEQFIERTASQWKDNYERSCEIIDRYIRKTRGGIGYKDTVRADVELKVKR